MLRFLDHTQTHTHKTNALLCLQRDSNPRFQQSSCCRPTPFTARLPGSASLELQLLMFRRCGGGGGGAKLLSSEGELENFGNYCSKARICSVPVLDLLSFSIITLRVSANHVNIQSGPKKCTHSLLIDFFGINLNEISISG